jgi:arylsulfatase A-like enzyme/Tfp pilus assembly protein PilF
MLEFSIPMRVLRRLLVLVFLALCADAAFAQPSKAPARSHAVARPNIILITLDTTRADRMGFLGSQGGLTPNLDALARQGVVFTRAYAHAPLTTISHASILTGTYPQFHHVNDFGAPLPKDVPFAPEILRARGYRTAAFVSSLILDPIEGAAPGFDRGFDVYDAGFHVRRPGEDRYQAIERRADEVVSRALAWVNRRRGGPFFLWIHLYDAHDPYDPPAPYKNRYASDPYDGEIAYTDSVVGKLLDQLRARGLYDGTMIAVMADHGEALGEHGETAHGVFLYDETLHVPLLFKLPQQRFAGQRIEARAALVDVLPTLLETAGVAVPKAIQGESLAAMMKLASRLEAVPDHVAYAENDYPRKAFGWSSLRALRTGKYLFVQAPRKELYDQKADPHAEHDLSATATAVTETLATQLSAFRQKTASSTAAPKGKIDPEQQQKLSALGYVASGSGDKPVGEGLEDTGADPKDKIEVVNLLHDAILLIEETRYKDAVPMLEKVMVQEPDIPIAYIQLGTAFTWLKEYEKAVPLLRRAVEMRPDQGITRYALGLALYETGDYEAAVPEMQAAIAKSPKWAALHFSLAAVYARLNRVPDAQKELEKTLELKPDHFRANLTLGRMFSLQGKAAAGLPRLKKAAKLQPGSREAHLFLADAYSQLGQQQNARRERAEAERLKAAGRP